MVPSVQPDLSLVAPAKTLIIGTIDSGKICLSSSFFQNLSLPAAIREDPLGIQMDRKMASFVSRSGRHLQRYNNGCRQVVGCIPYRKTKQSASVDGASCEELEVLVVSSRKSQRMMFPKGGWEHDESIKEAALRETIEEAGVVGKVGYQLGKWDFRSKSQGTSREGYMFSLLVEQQLDAWPEKDMRQRIWMKAADAREECQYLWMKEALDELVRRVMSTQQEKENETSATL